MTATLALSGSTDGSTWTLLASGTFPNTSSEQTVDLDGGSSGSGGSTSTPGTLGASVASMDFSAVNENSTSATQTVTLTHTGASGSEDVTISSVSLSGTHASQFEITFSAPVTLSVGQTAQVNIQFKPTSAGAKAALLQIAHDGSNNSPLQVSLTGTGVAVPDATLSLSTDTLDFGTITSGSKQMTLTLTHTGLAGAPDITIADMGYNPSTQTEFSDDLSSPWVLSVGETHDVHVTFTPGSVGNHSTLLQVLSDAVLVSPSSVVELNGAMGTPRVTDGLQVLFDFDSYTSGSTISSNVGNVTLTIDNSARVSPVTNGIAITASARLDSGSAPSLFSSLPSANAITIEAWIKPDSDDQGNFKVVASLSNPNNKNERDAALIQNGTKYQGRVRTPNTTDNGNKPATNTATGVTSGSEQHVVFTYSASDGMGRLYVNGVLKAEKTINGDFSNWVSSYRLIVGNEINTQLDARAWLGEIYTLAIYNKALSQAEINQNYAAGEA